MKKDCLLIGHNEMSFNDYKSQLSGYKGAAFELQYNYIEDSQGNAYTYHDMYNMSANQRILNKYGKWCFGQNLNAAISYLGSFLDKHDLSFDYINAFQTQKGLLADMLKNNEYRVIAISTTFYFSVFPIREIMGFIKSYKPSASIVLGGGYVLTNMRYEDIATRKIIHRAIKADYYIVNSKGEQTLVNIIHAIKTGKSIIGMDNVTCFDGNKIIEGSYVPEDNSLDDNLIQFNLFTRDLGYYVAMRTAISCPFQCSFCEFPQRAGKFSNISIASIKKQMDRINEIESIKSVYITDDTFNYPKDRFKEILRMMIKQNYRFHWHSFIRCQFLEEEVVELMKESKCEGILMGIESASEKMLKIMRKGATVEDYYRAMSMLNKYDITTFMSFVVGFPGETRETFNETLSFIKETKPDFFRPHVWHASPFIPIMKEKDKYGIEGYNYEWKHNTMDAKGAMNLYNRLYQEIDDTTWCPMYNFDFPGVPQFLAREMSIQMVRQSLDYFRYINRLQINKSNAPDFEQVKTTMKGIINQ